MVRSAAALLIGVLSVGVGCSSGEDRSGIQVTEWAVESIGEAPDSVIFSVTFVNRSVDEITFEGGGRQSGLDLEVRDSEGELVWNHLRGVVGGPATPYPVPAGRTETWTVTWPVVDTTDVRVAPGTYFLQGFLGDDLNVPVRPTPPLPVIVHR